LLPCAELQEKAGATLSSPSITQQQQMVLMVLSFTRLLPGMPRSILML
jgi:hypothetical protein